jgi:cytochrome c2
MRRIYLFLAMTWIGGLLMVGCAAQEQTSKVEGGDPARGAQSIQRQGCHSCHRIPGIPGANSYVGPPLNGWSARQYIAGSLQNTPDNLIAFIMQPQAIRPGGAMPDMDINEQDARDISAYLFTLEAEASGLWSQGD